MACRITNEEQGQGYDDRRFENPVLQGIICSICQGVLNNPKACQDKEHTFCHACILRHLQNSSTCPECREKLTPETLKNPPRFLMNYLLDQKINCDYNTRGCPDYHRLENLQNHVDECEFAPVTCEKCGMEVNRRDKDRQECREHSNPDQLEQPTNEKGAVKTAEMTTKDNAKCHECSIIKRSQERVAVQVDRVKGSQDDIKARQDQMNVELRGIKVEISEIETKQNETTARVLQLREGIYEIKRTQAEMKVDQVHFKADMKQEFQKVMGILNQLLPRANVTTRAQATYPAIPDNIANNSPEVIIIGGDKGPSQFTVVNTVEIYNVASGKSTDLPPMNYPRVEAASCLFNNDVIVGGGYNGRFCTDNIEILQMDVYPLRWELFGGKLPATLCSHSLIAYQDKLLVVGGINSTENRTSNTIYELSLVAPHPSKKLFKMLEARRNHSAEVIGDKLFVLGGTSTGLSPNAMDSIVSYDLTKIKSKRCKGLPYAVCGMSTVTWGNMIIVIGGAHKSGMVMNDVIMYDTTTEKIDKMPSMVYKRYGSSAVIFGDIIYVLGGWNQEQGFLNSVECLTIGNDFWVELPIMKERRKLATAVAKPRR